MVNDGYIMMMVGGAITYPQYMVIVWFNMVQNPIDDHT